MDIIVYICHSIHGPGAAPGTQQTSTHWPVSEEGGEEAGRGGRGPGGPTPGPPAPTLGEDGPSPENCTDRRRAKPCRRRLPKPVWEEARAPAPGGDQTRGGVDGTTVTSSLPKAQVLAPVSPEHVAGRGDRTLWGSGCSPRPLWRAGEGPWHPGKGHTAPTGSLPTWREPPGRGPQGFPLTPATSSGPSPASLSEEAVTCPREGSGQEEIPRAELGAKNSSAHPSKARQAVWAASGVS